MIVETLEEELVQVSFVDPDLPGNQFLSVTFEIEDRDEFKTSPWARVTTFEEACKKYLYLVR